MVPWNAFFPNDVGPTEKQEKPALFDTTMQCFMSGGVKWGDLIALCFFLYWQITNIMVVPFLRQELEQMNHWNIHRQLGAYS